LPLSSSIGSTRTIPKSRLPHEIIEDDVKFVETLGNVQVKYGQSIDDPTKVFLSLSVFLLFPILSLSLSLSLSLLSSDIPVRSVLLFSDGSNLQLLSSYDAVCVATGRYRQLPLNIPGESHAIPALEFLANPEKYDLGSKGVAVIGGGPVAIDCATVAAEKGKDVTLFYRRRLR
jgi:NADPH-dependent glutamate synthase beta subunit-like oxidoreductase